MLNSNRFVYLSSVDNFKHFDSQICGRPSSFGKWKSDSEKKDYVLTITLHAVHDDFCLSCWVQCTSVDKVIQWRRGIIDQTTLTLHNSDSSDHRQYMNPNMEQNCCHCIGGPVWWWSSEVGRQHSNSQVAWVLSFSVYRREPCPDPVRAPTVKQLDFEGAAKMKTTKRRSAHVSF